MRSLLACAVLAAGICSTALAETSVKITWLRHAEPERPVLSNLDPIPADRGRAGAQLALEDNQTTGRFLGQDYALEIVEVAAGDDPLGAARAALAETPYLVIDGPAASILAIADLPEAQGALLFNAAAEENTLRSEECRANLLHTLPSMAMRADALMQFAGRKRWDTLALIEGAAPEDAAWSEALRNSARKFGITVAARKQWTFDADMRRSAAGEVPLFTQDLPEHDLLVIADVANDFARYIPYNTWLPRPVAGSEGIMPLAWAPVVEQWGASQLHSRFHDLAGRDMTPRDYASWAAIRAIGEAVTRTGAADVDSLRGFILSDGFELAGFLGRPLSFRRWNGQMRQPIPLVTRSALVAQAPLEGYLHQRSELDTLGLDRPESACTQFQ